ncbi:hypothetical protein [Frankia sp. AvcI1]|uniref:hypothetical protein n=1 Tax=Frankia sp. AvcI1 TaxID=573496 RepID=UPI002119026C|nr:hypothetical protein [Frankia sp. AvcI1]
MDSFVPPVLVEKENEEYLPVTLVSARGAAGKSMAAVELAARLDAPLWRLELDKAVSATSLEYALGQYLGSHDVRSRLDKDRHQFIVVDSLDEARARVSGVSWTEFIESLGLLAEHGLRYVLFGRERTLEDVWVGLCDLNLRVAWWEISHFAAPQCAEYIDGVVQKRDPEATCSSFEYRAARDALVASLRSAAEGPHAGAFVGYPPVLDAVAAMLIKRPNLLSIRQQFEPDGLPAEGRIELLQRILGGLLERDQTKISSMAVEIGVDPKLTYRPHEQTRWLCHFLEGADPPDLAYIASATARQDYVKRISTFASEHPFRTENKWASPVFESYVASVEFDNSVFSPARLVEIGDTSGLLLDFVGGQSDLLITETQFAALHASIIASESIRSMTNTSIKQELDGTFDGMFAIDRGGEPARVTNFKLIPDSADVLEILGPLAELSVRSQGAVVIKGKPQGTVLGPDLFIHAGAVRFEGPALEFARRSEVDSAGGESEPSVVIEARDSLQLPPSSTQLPATSELEFRVSSEMKLHYPWFEYRVELVDEEAPDKKVVRFLNKLMNLTRAHGHSGERGTYIKKFEGRQPFPPAEFSAALAALVAADVVRIEGELIFLRNEWERYRYSGKALQGQRQLSDVISAWGPVIYAIEQSVWGR